MDNRLPNSDFDGEISYVDDMADTIHKATSNHPKGFTRIPKSKHRGYRKRVGGKYVYWYPEEHKAEVHLDWEDDVSVGRGIASLKAGNFVVVVGSPGKIYAWTPDAGKADPSGKDTWITPFDADHNRAAGTPIKVPKKKLQGQRSFDPEEQRRKRRGGRKKPKWEERHDPRKLERRKKPKAVSQPPKKRRQSKAEKRRLIATLKAKIEAARELLGRTGRRKLRNPDRIAALKTAISGGMKEVRRFEKELGQPPTSPLPSKTMPRTAVYEDSTAKAGTFLHKLENGHYPLVTFRSDPDDHFEHNRKSHGVFIPPQDVPALFDEFSDILINPARKVAKTYNISTKPEMDDLISGAKLGFMLALRSYTGGSPFEIHARGFASTYAGRAARDIRSGGAAVISKNQMQMLHGLMAAKARATAIEGKQPTDEQIAKEWMLTKKATFTGRTETLGVYPHSTKKQRAPRTAADKKAKRRGQIIGPRMVEQSNEQVPLGSWRVLGPDGKPRGREYQGKLSLIRQMSPILDGSRVEDSTWINENPGKIIPTGADSSLPLGAQQRLREDINSVFAEMPPDKVEILETVFGLADDPFEEKEQKEGGRGKGPRNKKKGYVMSTEELADRLGLSSPSDSVRTRQRKGKRAAENAELLFRNKARQLGKLHLAEMASDWDTAISPQRSEVKKLQPVEIGGVKYDKPPSYNELVERFTPAGVSIYMAGIRAGKGDEVAQKLDAWKQKKLSAKERDSLMRDYVKQRNQDRLDAYHRQSEMIEVDPSEVEDIGAHTGTSTSENWLYTPEIISGAMQAVVSGAKPSAAFKRPRHWSSAWSEEKFQDFMGRGERYRRWKQRREDKK